ncbi:MAG: cytochrome c [Flammeovirgaceae bacterium]|nr:cytochrome c [Flammeovirgaceae bacterium]
MLAILLVLFSCSKPDQNSADAADTVKIIASMTAIFSSKQAELGLGLYVVNCAACHGRDLRGTEGGGALMGDRFLSKWKEKSMAELFELTKATMPKTNPHSMDDASYAALLAFILEVNEFPSGETELSTSKDELQNIIVGEPESSRVAMQFIPKEADPQSTDY